jgi:hypothetical protein
VQVPEYPAGGNLVDLPAPRAASARRAAACSAAGGAFAGCGRGGGACSKVRDAAGGGEVEPSLKLTRMGVVFPCAATTREVHSACVMR